MFPDMSSQCCCACSNGKMCSDGSSRRTFRVQLDHCDIFKQTSLRNFQDQLGFSKISFFSRRREMASVNSRLSKPSQVRLNLYTNGFGGSRTSCNRCCQARCVATAHAKHSLQEFRWHFISVVCKVFANRAPGVQFPSVVPRSARDVNKIGCSKCSPGPSTCSRFSQIGPASSSTCSAAVDFNSFSPTSQP